MDATLLKAAKSDLNLFLLGETGVGKSWMARLLHEASPRSAGPFIEVHCASFPDGLIDSELFGHEKGAFTGATAARIGRFEAGHGGTLFLDEITECQKSVQPKLLRVLQESQFERVGGTRTHHVDVRVISASNRQEPREALREDLWYRLAEFPFRMPPLRERREEVERVVKEKSKLPISGAALSRLRGYPWPGNVRELISVVGRASVLSNGVEISETDVLEALRLGL